jgi:aminoglycoside phosphotransferase (APT) family kinase protein
MVRLLQFADKTRWAARVHITRSGYLSTKSRLQSEIATMLFIKENSDLPVAEVFAYELDEDNPVGAPFILMELLPGSVAMDTMGGYAVHRGIFPTECLESLCRSVAKCQVCDFPVL